MLQADSCCKSSHSWREAGSPRLICLTSNITNHLGPGNISFSSSLCLFSSLSVFAACLTVTSSPPVSYPWSFTSFWSFLVSSMCLSGGKTGGGGPERRGCFVSRFMPAGHHGSNDDNEMRGRVPLLIFLLIFSPAFFHLSLSLTHLGSSTPFECERQLKFSSALVAGVFSGRREHRGTGRSHLCRAPPCERECDEF